MIRELKVNIEKSKIPIVWLDTSVIKDISVYKSDPNKLQSVQRARIEFLYNTILQFTRDSKIICPSAGQDQEAWKNRSDWTDTMHELSMGIFCRAHKSIWDSQLIAAMKTYSSNGDSIELNYIDAFHQDPVEEIENINESPVFIVANTGVYNGIDYQRNLKHSIIDAWNEARKKNVTSKVSLSDQIQIELNAEFNTKFQMALRYANGQSEHIFDENDFAAFNDIMGRIDLWGRISGRQDDLSGLGKFHKSNAYFNCPRVKIESALIAKLMVDPQPIRSGDWMDVRHISTFMPYADLFITDKAWATYLNQYSYDGLYNTAICYIGNFKVIENFFQSI